MSVPSEYFAPKFRPGAGVRRRTEPSAERQLETARWTHVGLGAIALGLYLLFAATAKALWPVLLGPFVLVVVARLMGVRSLWK